MKTVAANAGLMSAAMRAASLVGVAAMFTLGAALVGVAAHAVALGQSAIVASQSLLLLPAAIGFAVSVAVAGKLAFSGMGEAWKATGAAARTGGGASVDIAHRVEVANRGVRDATQALVDAQREALAAQEAVTRAREDAAERLEDLSRSLRGAQLDERGAVLALQEARTRLSQARRSGDVTDIKRAQLAYEEAGLSLETVRDRVQDLSKEQQQANEKGVEGSEEVQSAIARQEQAQRQLTAATERLADAQRQLGQAGQSAGGGVDKAAQALAALAPSAAALVLTLRAMGPAWAAAGKNAQQATWAGVAGDMENLGMIYLPRVAQWATRMGEAFNLAIRETLGLAQTNEFADNVGMSLGFIDQTMLGLARSIAPFVNGLLAVVTVGSSFLPGIAGNVDAIAHRFEDWALSAARTGQMQQWISTGLVTLGQFWQLAKNLVGSLLALFKAGENTATLDGLVAGTAAMRKWLESAQGQQKVAEVLAFLRSLLSDVASVATTVAGNADTLSAGFSVFGTVVKFAAENLDLLVALLPVIAAGFVIAKVAQTGANLAMVVGIPLRLVELVTTWKANAAMRAHTAALLANTGAQRVSAASTALGSAATNGSTVAMTASKVATGALTAGTWLLNIAMRAIPIILIVTLIIGLVAWIIHLWKTNEGFRTVVLAVWGAIWGLLQQVGAWFAGPFVDFFRSAWDWIVTTFNAGVAWVSGWVNRFLEPILAIKRRIEAVGIWQVLVEGLRAAVNGLISLWNRLDFSIGPFAIPTWVPFIGGQRFHVPDIFPDLPFLDVGGHVTATGMAVVHEGETVMPARTTPLGGRRDVVELRSDGSAISDWIIELLRKAVRDRGGDVQFVLGK